MAYPRKGPDTRERFEMRHKWAVKLPTMPDGSKVETGLSPRYDDWIQDRQVNLEVRYALWTAAVSLLIILGAGSSCSSIESLQCSPTGHEAYTRS